jgi:hypothetical protein
MGKFVLAYRGGSTPEAVADQEALMFTWMNWFGSLGEAVVDFGNPFGSSATVGADRTVTDGGRSELTGYSIITADDLAAAAEIAKGCPVFDAGGTVEVYEAVPIG